MPLFIYKCLKCGYTKEILMLGRKRKKIYKCPKCKKIKMKRTYNGQGFIYRFKCGFNTRKKNKMI